MFMILSVPTRLHMRSFAMSMTTVKPSVFISKNEFVKKHKENLLLQEMAF